jgi:LPXTG-motif cell wall-anchored protein
METRRGIAQKVRIGSEVSGDSQNVSTTYVAVFELDGVVVHAASRRTPTIADGDEVVVAGRFIDGVFNAPAMRNLTRGTVDHQTWWVGLLVGAVFVTVGVGIAIAALQQSDTRWFALLGLALATLGGWVVRSSNRTRMAEAAVRAA